MTGLAADLQEKMVIKDLLNKVSKPADPNNPQVKQLRDKLAQLQQKGQAKPAESKPAPQEQPSQKPVPKNESDLQRLQKASDEEQRRFAVGQDPKLRITEERTQKLMAQQITEVIDLVSELSKRITKLEGEKVQSERGIQEMIKRNDDQQQKMQLIDQRLEKFMGLYEIITNQHNPFADGSQGVPDVKPMLQQDKPPAPPAPVEPAPAAQKVRVSDNLSGDDAEVEIAQGSISSENARKMQQLLAELERDEREKKGAEPEKVQEIVRREEETQKLAVSELQEVFAGFEERLKQYLDSSVQDRLHHTFSALEGVLNEEIGEAVKQEVSKLKQNEDIIASALQELEALQEKAPEPERFKEEASSVIQEVRSLDDQIKSIPPNLYFRLSDGRVLKSVKDLVFALQTMNDSMFGAHVSDERNDFADWLELALERPEGKDLRGKSRKEMATLLQSLK